MILELLVENAFHPLPRKYKAKGKLERLRACSDGHDLRIVFEFVQHEGSEAILLETIGSHQEVS